MFSRRTGWNRELNPLARRLEEIRRGEATLLDLTESNPTRVGLSPPVPAWSEGTSADRYAPDPRGLRSARESLAAWLSERGPAVSPDQLVLTSSTSEAHSWLLKLLCEPGDDVLVPRPSYPLFEYLVGLESVEAREYPLHFDGVWHLSVDSVAAVATERTRAVLVVNPANPTGNFLKSDELGRLSGLCADSGWALVCDEVFADYPIDGAPDDRVVRAASEASRVLTFSLSGLSKSVALPQLKLGWIVVAGPEEVRHEALGRLEVIADTYLSVNSPAQYALPRILAVSADVQARVRERLRQNRERLEALQPPDRVWNVLRAEGGWMAIVRLPSRASEEEVCLRLLDERVVVHPGYFFDFAASCYLVLSLLPEPDVFAEGAARMARVLDGL